MKRLLAIILLLSLATMGWAQTVDGISDYTDGFQGFVDEFTKSLPMNSTVGLNYSDAYIGQLLRVPPNVALGITTGVTTIPYRAFDGLFDDLGVDIPSEISDFSAVGVPFPAYAIDARIGGFVLPFDVGVKFGTIPNGIDVGDVSLEYTLIGADIRYALIEQGIGIRPDLSVAVGYNRLNGAISMPSGIGQLDIADVPTAVDQNGNATNTSTISLEDPTLDFDWGANVFDFRAQASKKILFIEPHFGLGAAIGVADSSAGLTTEVLVDGTAATQQQLNDIKDAAEAAGQSVPEEFDTTGILVSSNVNNFAFRVFGGASLNIVLFRLDLGLMYNITSGSVGGTVGARIQL